MNKILTENWNSVVSQEDILIHLGDFSFGKVTKYLPYLNGKIILVRGNHDRGTDIKNCGLEIYQNLDFDYAGYRFKLNHRPVFEPNTIDEYNDQEKHAEIDLKQYDYVLCGHIHEKWLTKQKNINVGVDVWNFKPVSIDRIIELIKTL